VFGIVVSALVTALALAQGARAQGNPSAVAEAAGRVHAVLDDLEKAYAARDAAAIEQLTSDQVLAVLESDKEGADPFVFDKKALLTALKSVLEKSACSLTRRESTSDPTALSR
jgi:predicted lipid-binding transport protein (Tim44 family)